MQNILQGRWAPRLASFVLTALAAGSAAYWVLRWLSMPGAEQHRAVAVASMEEAPITPDAGRLARLLGASGQQDSGDADAAASRRWRLVGVVAGPAGRGAALIAEDDKPVKPYVVGSKVADDLFLKSVAARRAMLAPGMDAPVSVTLEIRRPDK